MSEGRECLLLFAPSEDLGLDSPVLTPGVDLSAALTADVHDPQTIPSTWRTACDAMPSASLGAK